MPGPSAGPRWTYPSWLGGRRWPTDAGPQCERPKQDRRRHHYEESLRAALNIAYRVKEHRPYPVCVLESSLFVVLSAFGMLALAWGVVVGPQLAARFKPSWMLWLADTGWVALIARYAIVTTAIGVQLAAYHLWLAAGRRTLGEVWPGVLISIVLWLLAAQLFASWLSISNYSRFYAGLTSIMSALVFFQVSSVIVILGAELNRGLVEVKRRIAGNARKAPETATTGSHWAHR